MLIKKALGITSSEITPKRMYLNRRKFLAGTAVTGLAAAAGMRLSEFSSPEASVQANAKIEGIQKSSFSTTEKITPYKDVTNYNNYYEFSTDKYGPAGLAKDFKTRPWTVTIDGLVPKKQVVDVDTIVKWATPEERIYRHRCVEGLRLDEAMHPLATLCFGMYGEVLPNQDGAPLRIVVPWKYGFKSAKAIVRVRFTDRQPLNSWNKSAPDEYGFYSNVNPNVDHPRWSQAKERRLGEFLKRPTLMFNGYDQVASLYSGMDLKKNF